MKGLGIMDCIFCKIASRGAKAAVVEETARLVVIRDINPQAPAHFLIIPKEHYPTVLDCKDRDLLGEMLEVAGQVARKFGFDQKGFRTVINTNEEGGQTVLHLHMHLLAGRPLAGRMG